MIAIWHSSFLSPLRVIVASTSEHSVLYQIGKQQKRAKLNWEVDLWTRFQTFSTALSLCRFFRLFSDHRNLLCAHHNLIAKKFILNVCEFTGAPVMPRASQIHKFHPVLLSQFSPSEHFFQLSLRA